MLAGVFTEVEQWAFPVPEPVLGLAVLVLAAVLIDREGQRRWYGEYPSMWLPPADLLAQLQSPCRPEGTGRHTRGTGQALSSLRRIA